MSLLASHLCLLTLSPSPFLLLSASAPCPLPASDFRQTPPVPPVPIPALTCPIPGAYFARLLFAAAGPWPTFSTGAAHGHSSHCLCLLLASRIPTPAAARPRQHLGSCPQTLRSQWAASVLRDPSDLGSSYPGGDRAAPHSSLGTSQACSPLVLRGG